MEGGLLQVRISKGYRVKPFVQKKMERERIAISNLFHNCLLKSVRHQAKHQR